MSDAEKLTLALPKGRVMDESLEILRRVGLELNLKDKGRALKFDAGDALIIEMRNSDVPTYVDLGVADAGIVGKDVLVESGRNIFEPVDLGFQACRLSFIRPRDASGPVRRVASKYPGIALTYLRGLGNSAEVIKLSGSVELACLTGLTDGVVDIVQTGGTLRANGLEEVDVIMQSSARLVVNRAALKLKAETLRPLIARLREAAAESQKSAA